MPDVLLDPTPDVGVLSYSSTGRKIKCTGFAEVKCPISEKSTLKNKC